MAFNPAKMVPDRGHVLCAGGATTLCIEAIPPGYYLTLLDLAVTVRDNTPVQTQFFVQITNPVSGTVNMIAAAESQTDAAGVSNTASWTSPKVLYMYPGEFLTVQVPVATSGAECDWQSILLPMEEDK